MVKREFSSRVFAISTANELEILNKVRDYIRLNENYLDFMMRSECAPKDDPSKSEELLKNETEVSPQRNHDANPGDDLTTTLIKAQDDAS